MADGRNHEELREKMKKVVQQNRMKFLEHMKTVVITQAIEGLHVATMEKIMAKYDREKTFHANIELLDEILRLDTFWDKLLQVFRKEDICPSLVEILEKGLRAAQGSAYQVPQSSKHSLNNPPSREHQTPSYSSGHGTATHNNEIHSLKPTIQVRPPSDTSDEGRPQLDQGTTDTNVCYAGVAVEENKGNCPTSFALNQCGQPANTAAENFDACQKRKPETVKNVAFQREEKQSPVNGTGAKQVHSLDSNISNAGNKMQSITDNNKKVKQVYPGASEKHDSHSQVTGQQEDTSDVDRDDSSFFYTSADLRCQDIFPDGDDDVTEIESLKLPQYNVKSDLYSTTLKTVSEDSQTLLKVNSNEPTSIVANKPPSCKEKTNRLMQENNSHSKESDQEISVSFGRQGACNIPLQHDHDHSECNSERGKSIGSNTKSGTSTNSRITVMSDGIEYSEDNEDSEISQASTSTKGEQAQGVTATEEHPKRQMASSDEDEETVKRLNNLCNDAVTNSQNITGMTKNDLHVYEKKKNYVGEADMNLTAICDKFQASNIKNVGAPSTLSDHKTSDMMNHSKSISSSQPDSVNRNTSNTVDEEENANDKETQEDPDGNIRDGASPPAPENNMYSQIKDGFVWGLTSALKNYCSYIPKK